MANIFGKEIADYAHLAKLDSVGKLDAHMRGMSQRGSKLDFNALQVRPVMMDANEITSQALGFITNNMQAVQAEIDHIEYTQFRLNELFTLKTGIPEGASSYSYKVMDKTGKGKFITQRGTDAGSASVSMENVPYLIEYAGIEASWSVDELRQGNFAGVALDTETINAATTGAMDHIEEVGLIGSPAQGFKGLVNNTDVAAGTTPTTIAIKTADELTQFLQAAISQIVRTSKEVVGRNFKTGMTIYLPTLQFGDVTERKLSTDADKTVWEYVETNNLFTRMTGNKVQLRSVIELEDVGVGTTDRMIVGVNDARVLEMATPIMPRALTSQLNGFMVNVPIEYKISGLNFKRPSLFTYTDGV